MAAEVPVCDVLCEAMEYLCKLGSNLRTRSESLKEKKINKNKLKNAHAVNKAAKKVLLICELSKKSLENVETGIKKVLSIVDASQAQLDVGGKRKEKTRDNKQIFFHFECDSYKLRISKKIPLKHYMSVKVLARSMPVSMLEKYPVFYDCKLKRKREKKQEFEKELERSARRKSSTCLSDTNEEIKKDSKVIDTSVIKESKDKKSSKTSFDCNVSDSQSQDVTENSNDDLTMPPDSLETQCDDLHYEQRVHKDSSNNQDNSDAKNDPKKSNAVNNEEDITENKHINLNNSCITETNNDKQERDESSCEEEKSINDKHSKTNRAKCKSGEKKDGSAKKKLWKVKFVDNSSESDEVCSKDKLNETSQTVNNSSSEENEHSENEFSGYEPQTIRTKQSDTNNDCESDNTSVSKDNKNEKEAGDDSKPLIRCVNITKLLKPVVLDTKICELPEDECEKPKSSSADSIKYKEHKKRIFEYFASKRTKELNRQKKKDEKFWEKKRIEVKKFVPKQFSVNIERLPKLSVKFLITHNLQKVSQGSKIILELTTENKKEFEHFLKNINNVKNALLNDSDSENGEQSTIVEEDKVREPQVVDSNSDQEQYSSINKVDKINKKNISDPAAIKNALLNDSDSDKNSEKVEKDIGKSFDSGSDDSHKQLEQEVAEKIKSVLLNDSDSDKSQSKGDKNEEMPSTQHTTDEKDSKPSNSEKEDNDLSQNNKNENALNNSPFRSNEQEETTQNSEKIKSSLLNDSSDIESVSSDTKKNKKKIKTPKHKRKHAMKSTQAKKMLIKYSSSSENEDDNFDNKRSNNKRGRIKAFDSSSSSGEERAKKKKLQDSSPEKSDQENESRDIDQVDGTIDEHSDNSVSKMVRSKAKPSGSSSQNSSNNQDSSDKDIDGLTDLNSLNKTRRRDASSTNNTRSSAKRNSSKSKPILGEDLLQTVSSSDASDDDDIAEEDLPPIQMSALNGDGISHLAKDDLLGDSDSSMSHKDQSESAQNIEDSEAEEDLKLKRRKANAISSDDEGSTSRAKRQDDDDVQLSGFEDSEDESSDNKRSKRKKIVSDSDGSAGSSNDGKKKRKRIKQVNDSDMSGSDSENEGKNKHGRKNIRKVMGKNQLEEATKKAAREEKERIARIAERQKVYNNLEFDESGKPDEVVLEKVVLDFDPETKEPLIEVDRGLVKKLKPHQANGIKFMWDACFESAKRIKKDRGSGCILAHCMGLGKTLQVISLTHTLLTHGSLTGVNRVLVVCPLSTVLNWVNEFHMWLKHADSKFDVDVYELSRYKQNSERAFQLQQWFDGGGVCVLGYEMFRNLSADNPKKYKKKMLRSFQESLVDPGPDLVVCDEGHLLKNEKTSLSQSMNRVKTRRRIVLTGTPLQNNLKEYYCMVQFVKPNLLGKYNEYLNRFVNPITNGQYTDSTEHDIKIMKRRSHVLHTMLDGAVQRRDYGVLAPFLPPKHEYVLFITLTDVQVKLYQYYLDNYSRRPLPGKSSGFLFPDFQSLQRIWTHPLVLKYNSERYEIMQQKKREREEEDSEGSLVDFIDDDSTPDESSTEESSDDSSELSDDSRKKSKKKNKAKKGKGKEKESKGGSRRGTRANPVEIDDEPEITDVVEVKNENPTEWWIKLVEDEELDDMRNSSKLVLLFDILRQCETIGDKLLVFSQSLYSLDLIEHFLGKVDEATQEGRIDEKLGGHVGSWSPGVDYFRLDGSTSCENRSIWCKNFNREDNPRARLFLISTRAGGLGINLVAANRVVIFDVSWNPSHDVQSIFRVYRFGQKKPCYVYRFLAMGTMEEKIYERQVTKQAISKRVIDEQQIDRHYAENDLAELYKFEARPAEPRPIPSLPKDRLFAEMLREHEAQIYKYHEHDSLLENKEEETLSEEERKAAWEDFENEKNKPPPAPFPSAWPMHNGMVPGLLAQQQQQLAFAAIAAMLRKDVPNINDNQIRDVLPAIYNSNPGLMQKMSEIYKYAQPGMMNPGMMNAVMNPASGGAAAGMGGTSGLQYEPPWQRQHQQQQQMRLQQLMQQQNQMGAKFYAGGLGSRDPVAMALQQQRAREIMMGGGAGRPRGRPPLAPRSAAPSQDVVNLDSD